MVARRCCASQRRHSQPIASRTGRRAGATPARSWRRPTAGQAVPEQRPDGHERPGGVAAPRRRQQRLRTAGVIRSQRDTRLFHASLARRPPWPGRLDQVPAREGLSRWAKHVCFRGLLASAALASVAVSHGGARDFRGEGTRGERGARGGLGPHRVAGHSVARALWLPPPEHSSTELDAAGAECHGGGG
jgi:hypothetical protein